MSLPLPLSPRPLLPPSKRSRSALRLTAAAAMGRFELQRCVRCFAIQYPPREACHRCLSVDLKWTLQTGTGQLISETTLFHSHEAFFRQRLPLRVGLVRLDAGVSVASAPAPGVRAAGSAMAGASAPGPTVVAYVHRSVPTAPTPVVVTVRLDMAGQAVLIARPPAEDIAMNDDPHIREMGCDPQGRDVFVTDGSSALGQALIREFAAAGAHRIWVGRAPDATIKQTASDPSTAISIVPIDVRSSDSVRGAAQAIEGDLGIVVNNDRYQGGARSEMEANYFGLLNLTQHFESRVSGAWVNLLTLDALCSIPSQATFSASMAAALSLSQALRARLRPAGVRVVNVFAGPVGPDSLSRSVVTGLREGVEDVFPGDMAQDWLARWLESPKVLEREVAR